MKRPTFDVLWKSEPFFIPSAAYHPNTSSDSRSDPAFHVLCARTTGVRCSANSLKFPSSDVRTLAEKNGVKLFHTCGTPDRSNWTNADARKAANMDVICASENKKKEL